MSEVRQTVAGTEYAVPSSNGEAEFDDHNHDLKEHVRDLTQETVHLVKQELELLRAELREKTDFVKEQVQVTGFQARTELEHAKADLAGVGKKAGAGAGLIGGGALVGLGAFGAMTVALIAGLAVTLPLWASALVVTAGFGALAVALALAGRAKLKQVGLPFPETVGRFKALLNFRKDKIRSELAEVPQETLGSLTSVKDDLQEAWQKGSEHRSSR